MSLDLLQDLYAWALVVGLLGLLLVLIGAAGWARSFREPPEDPLAGIPEMVIDSRGEANR